MGLQESLQQVGEFGVQVNRAFGACDTVVYLPLMAVSVVGLLLKRRWSLLTTAAALAVSAYWSVTAAFMLTFLSGVSSYSLVPGPMYWICLGAYIVFGVGGLFYLIFRGDALLR